MNTYPDITPEEFEMLEQYILKQLPIAEQEAFTKRLEGDAVLRQKLHSVKLLLIGVQEAALTKKNRTVPSGIAWLEKRFYCFTA